jgi:hypothetical protein
MGAGRGEVANLTAPHPALPGHLLPVREKD